MSTSVNGDAGPVELALQSAAVAAPGRGVHDRLVGGGRRHTRFNALHGELHSIGYALRRIAFVTPLTCPVCDARRYDRARRPAWWPAWASRGTTRRWPTSSPTGGPTSTTSTRTTGSSSTTRCPQLSELGRPPQDAAQLRAGRPAASALLPARRHQGRHRHLRRPLPGAERRHPRAGDGARRALRRSPRSIGFRHGYAGLVPGAGRSRSALTPDVVHDINEQGGTILGTSRGAQDPDVMVDRLRRARHRHPVRDRRRRLDARRGRHRRRRCAARDLPIGVIGIPKTIDNDIPFIGQSFGFVTAFSAAAKAINAAHGRGAVRRSAGSAWSS